MRHECTVDLTLSEPTEASEALPLDAAESAWDPVLWALYLRELAREHPPTLH